MTRSVRLVSVLLAIALAAHAGTPLLAQAPAPSQTPAAPEPSAPAVEPPAGIGQEAGPGAEAPAEEDPLAELLREVGARTGPLTADLGGFAELTVPEGIVFVDGAGTKMFLERTQNFPSGEEVGLVLGTGGSEVWWAIFRFEETGYVEDAEKDELDADALLESIQTSNAEGNEERKRRGWDTVDVVGWEKAPFYDEKTNNLTWALRTRSSDGDGVNWDVRLLGRRGVMKARLICGVDALPTILPGFDALVGTFQYKQGHKYAEFQKGDKIAEYGLGALVLGGAGVAAFKLGFFSKFWKVIAVGLVAVGAFLKNMWGRLFGGKPKAPDEPPPLPG
ncbi:MAG: DUF2167 domain-containing protein [Planctomycetes bacterium]|nr:DUF2167 domain-containing protein [Planctomycetota bacterium]